MKLRLHGVAQVIEHTPPNKPMKRTVAIGARSLSAKRWADKRRTSVPDYSHLFRSREEE